MKKRNNNKNTTLLNIKELCSHIDWYNVLISMITFVVVSIFCVYFSKPEENILIIGDKAPKTIIAKSIVSFRDLEIEKYIRDEYINKTIGYSKIDNSVPNNISTINSLFSKIKSIKKTHSLSQNTLDLLNLRISPYIKNKLNDDSIFYLLICSESEFDLIEDKVIYVSSYLLSKPLKDNSYYLEEAYKEAEVLLNNKYNDSNNNSVAYDIIINTLKPNYVYSENETRYIRNKLLLQEPEIYRTILPGEIIVSKGQIIDKYNFEILKNAGLLKNSIFNTKILGLFLIILFSFIYILVFLNKFKLLKNNIKKSLLLSIIVILCFIGIFFVCSLSLNTFDNYKLGFISIMWIVATSMLIYNLLSKYLSMFMLVFLSIIMSYVFGNDIRILTLSLICGMCALWAVSKIYARAQLIIVYLFLLIITALQIFIIGLVYNEKLSIIVFEQIKYGILFIPLSVLIYYVFSAILERLFNLSTEMRLLELSSADNYLLKHLAIKAPGTYTHCVAVSYIAELCAEKIKANTLLTKVGAFYHDIGKINNPNFFTENQYSENIHNDIKPQLSVMVIRSHVKMGIQYAKKYKLPEEIINIIREHHGTSLVSYFFHQFKDNNTSIVNIESQFRYEGPKPQTKESAIVMIADSIEAASRSIKDPTHSKIEQLVNSIVSAKLSDGQFNECPLTLGDINQIKLICIKSLMHTLHTRISYPQSIENKNDENKEDI